MITRGQLASMAQTAPADQLIGSWELQERSAQGMGTTYEFRADSALVISTGVMVDIDVRLQGDELVGTVLSKRGHEEPVRIRAIGDSLSYIEGRDEPQRWIRVRRAAPGQPAFAGLWAVDKSVPLKGKRKNDETAQLMRDNMRIQIMLADAAPGSASGALWRVRMRCPLENSGGSYTVQANKLIMQYGGKVWVAAFRFDGNTLHLIRRGESAESVFGRVE
jgi:hypothetical protein